MNLLAAVEAEPLEAVAVLGAARAFDHEPDRARDRALRRMAHVRRQHEDLALTDGHVVDLSVLGDLHDDVAAQLVEELLHRVVVEIHALVWTAHDLHRHAGVLEHQLVGDGGLQEVLVGLDPFLEIEGFEAGMQHSCSPGIGRPDCCRPSARTTQSPREGAPSRQRTSRAQIHSFDNTAEC